MEQAIAFSDFSGKRILEIGVGLGSDHYRFARADNHLFGVDLSSVHLQHARRHLANHDLTTRPVCGDMEALPFADATFDLVYAFGVLHHTPNPRLAASELRRVLRPGGQAIVAVYHLFSWFFLIQTVLFNGVWKGGLWKKGWRRLLSEIEYRDEGNAAVPLVEVYSRHRARRLFCDFDEIEIETHHVQSQDFAFLGPLLERLSRPWLESRLGFGGWYLLVRARKAK